MAPICLYNIVDTDKARLKNVNSDMHKRSEHMVGVDVAKFFMITLMPVRIYI